MTGQGTAGQDAGPAVPFEQEDLVVSLPHRDLVVDRLRTGFGVEATVVDSDSRLDLALLRLRNLRDRAMPLRDSHAEEIGRLERMSVVPNRFTDLDVLLMALRAALAAEFGGWRPPMGKNRHVATVTRLGGRHDPMGLLASPFGGRHDPMGAGNPHPVDAPDARPPAAGPGAGVRIGILDTPLYPHRRLLGGVPESELLMALMDLRPHGPTWAAWEGHATFVADLVRRQAPSATLAHVAVLDSDLGKATGWEVAKGMVGFAGSGVAILNLSLGCFTADGQPPLLMTQAVDKLTPGVLLVAAAGNHAVPGIPAAQAWPAALPAVVAVGATREEHSGFSPEEPWVTCTAAGVDVVGAYLTEKVTLPPPPDRAAAAAAEALPARPAGQDATAAAAAETVRARPAGQPETDDFHGYARWSGTSFAAATASGAIAARMTAGRSARDALDELLAGGDAVVKKYEHSP